MMRWYHYLLLTTLGLVVAIGAAYFQRFPGYMDADYYFSGGTQLVNGSGFNEMILWNYLDNPKGLPHPSHAYWMPLASIISAIGMWLTGTPDFVSARITFILITAFIPPLTALLSFSIFQRKEFALASGCFAAFSGYYVAFLSTTDTFGIYILLGVLFFLLLGYAIRNQDIRSRIIASLGLGLIAGLAHLSRADGMLWLIMAILASVFLPGKSKKEILRSILVVIIGYLVVMTPWYIRNYSVFGTILAPGGSKALWLTNYDQTYSYPSDKLSFHSWIESGWTTIAQGRVNALVLNLQTTWAVQGMIFLFPFILIGAWNYRWDFRVKLGVIAWLLVFVAMTFVFPFAGSRGGFFHSGAALMPLWWSLAPVGLERAVYWLEIRRNWRKGEAFRVFLAGSIAICILMSFMLYYSRVISFPGWGYESKIYRNIENALAQNGALPGEPVMVGNPPGYFSVTGRPAIAVPNEPLPTVIEAAKKFGVSYLVLESGGTPEPLRNLFEDVYGYPQITFIGVVEGAKIFTIP